MQRTYNEDSVKEIKCITREKLRLKLSQLRFTIMQNNNIYRVVLFILFFFKYSFFSSQMDNINTK